MRWSDISAIAEALYEKYPDVDPTAIRFTDLHNWVVGLDVLFMPAVGCVLIAMAFSVMGALMGRAWYTAAGLYALTALGMTAGG